MHWNTHTPPHPPPAKANLNTPQTPPEKNSGSGHVYLIKNILTVMYFLTGIQQKNIVVTCNYVARRYGVTKLMYIKDAKEKCPQLVLVSGEDLTNYRNMSYKISGMNEKTSAYFYNSMEYILWYFIRELPVILHNTCTGIHVLHCQTRSNLIWLKLDKIHVTIKQLQNA